MAMPVKIVSYYWPPSLDWTTVAAARPMTTIGSGSRPPCRRRAHGEEWTAPMNGWSEGRLRSLLETTFACTVWKRLRDGGCALDMYQWHMWDACSEQGDACSLSLRYSTCVSFTVKRR